MNSTNGYFATPQNKMTNFHSPLDSSIKFEVFYIVNKWTCSDAGL
jgi:hypothetical protein